VSPQEEDKRWERKERREERLLQEGLSLGHRVPFLFDVSALLWSDKDAGAVSEGFLRKSHRASSHDILLIG
jgi:hypothetical protein